MRTPVAAAVAIVLAVGAPGLGMAASAALRPAASLPDWSGLWLQSDGTPIDPSVKRGERQNPPLTPPYAKIYDERIASAARGVPLADPGCLPSGTPRIMRSPYPFELAVTAKQVWVLHEFKAETRRIYTDGRPHPTGDKLEPSYYGHSIGHWEGDTLVVSTVGLRGDTTLDSTSMPHSDKLTVLERMRRVDANTFQIQMTLTDPEAFTRPWTLTRTYKLRPAHEEIREYVCAENERNPIGADGQTLTIVR